ncbi:MAG TPA: hypothetical protein VF813_04805, partial [Anaerolineaceae bacterium]
GLVELSSDLGEGDAPSRRIYSLTTPGYRALDEWYACGTATEGQRDEFYIKLMVSLTSGYGDPYHILTTQRAITYQRLHAVTNQRNELDSGIDLAQVLLLDKAIMYLEADLRWLDMIESRLDEIKSQPRARPELKPRGRPKKTAA